jgi:two-component system, OmpR family, sensor kinase
VTARSIVARVARAALLSSLVTAMTFATAAALISLWLWRSEERRDLRQAVEGLRQAVHREADDERSTLEAAAPEAVRESDLAGYRIEVWVGERLIAANTTGTPLGPLHEGAPAGWLVEEQPVSGSLRVLVGARSRDGEALRVFGWSLLLALPACLAVAVVIGRLAGGRATGALVEFKRRILEIRPFGQPPDEPIRGASAEVEELDAAFRSLWKRLSQALARESDFAANASHELRTPLTRIRLHAERALAETSPEGRIALAAQMEEIDRMARLADSLLVLARDVAAGIPNPEVVNLADVARSLAERALAARRTDLARLPEEALVRGDEALLGIAVENLLENAAKFSTQGQAVGISLADRAGRVRLVVTSPGARVAAHEKERVFERFYRNPEARPAPKGHGLGLPLARHIARLHGGDVLCVSGPDEDAAFVLELPAWAPGPAAA